jgi:hypothetical protein
MNLEFVVSEIDKSMPEIENWLTMVVEDMDMVETDNFSEYQALSIEVEHDDKEINIRTNQKASEGTSTSEPLTVGQLVSQLRRLLPQCANYSVYSASTNISDGEHWIRFDIPLVAIGVNRKDQTFGLIQMGKKAKDA